jgi:hypothetical protein
MATKRRLDGIFAQQIRRFSLLLFVVSNVAAGRAQATELETISPIAQSFSLIACQLQLAIEKSTV